MRADFGGLVEFEKPSIETRFCFGYHDSMIDTESYDAANDACENFGETQFLRSNLKDMREALRLFEYCTKHDGPAVKSLYFTREYSSSNIYKILFLDEYSAKDKAWRFDGLTKATDEDFRKCFEAQKKSSQSLKNALSLT